MTKKACVLIYGKDASLLGVRRLVIQQAGFRVLAVTNLADLTQQRIKEFGMLVLCHTLSSGDQQEAIRVCGNAKAGIRTVVLMAYAPEFRLNPDSSFISPFEGPETLISRLRAMSEQSSHPTYRQA
jgi:hypothetical protein